MKADCSYYQTPETIPVSFEEKKVEIEADPCLQHDMITVDLEHGPSYRNVISYVAGYNVKSLNSCQNFKPEYLYGGLLKDKVFNKTCKKEGGEYLIPAIPKEVQHCVKPLFMKSQSS